MTAITADRVSARPSSSRATQENMSANPIERLASALGGKKTHRVQLELPPRSMERLAALKEVTEAASYAEVVRNAIRLYEAMVSEAHAGRQFLIKDPSGTITPYNVFLEA